MSDTTFEEAARCPKCSQPGEDRRQLPVRGKPGVRVHYIYCGNPVCPWLDTPWLVQVNADGTIPEAGTSLLQPKQYPSYTPQGVSRKERAEKIRESIRRAEQAAREGF